MNPPPLLHRCHLFDSDMLSRVQLPVIVDDRVMYKGGMKFLIIRRRCPTEVKDLDQLVDVAVAVEKDILRVHFAENAAMKKRVRRCFCIQPTHCHSPDAPYIHLGTIKRLPHDKLRRTIPSGHHHVRVKVIITVVHGVSENRTSEAEIGYLKVTLVVNEQVRRLEITMNDVVLMQIQEKVSVNDHSWKSTCLHDA